MKGCHWIIQSQRPHPFSLLNMLCQNDDDDGEVHNDDDDDHNDDDGDDDAGGGIDKWIWLGRTRCTDDRNAFQLEWIASQMCQEEEDNSNEDIY